MRYTIPEVHGFRTNWAINKLREASLVAWSFDIGRILGSGLYPADEGLSDGSAKSGRLVGAEHAETCSLGHVEQARN